MVQKESDGRGQGQTEGYDGDGRPCGETCFSVSITGECDGEDESGEEKRVRLDAYRDAGAEGGEREGPLRSRADSLERGRGDEEQQGGFHQVALAGLAHAVASVEEPEEGGRGDAGEPVVRESDDEHGERRGEHKESVEDAPSDGAAAEGVDDGPVDHERARQIHVRDLAEGRETAVHEEADVVLKGAVIDKRPVAGEDETSDDEGDEPERERHLGAVDPA